MTSPQQDQLYDPSAAGQAQSTEKVGGPRHAPNLSALAERDARSPWKCPSCGEENTTRALGEGCEHCHAGEGAARFKGVDPVVPKRRQAALQGGTPGRLLNEAYGTPGRLLNEAYGAQQAKVRWIPMDGDSDLQAAFLQWMQHAGTEVGPLAAFSAGWNAARAVTYPVIRTDDHGTSPLASDDVVGGHLPDPDGARPGAESPEPVPSDPGREAEPGEPDPGAGGFPSTAEDRTLLAALTFLREQVYSQQPEEARSGEWLKPEQLDEWIRTLKGPYA